MPEDIVNTAKAVSVVPQLVELLEGLSPTERDCAVSAAMILIGDNPGASEGKGSKDKVHTEFESISDGVSARAASWMNKNSITREKLEHVFSIDAAGVDVIAAKLPAKSKRQQTIKRMYFAASGSLIRAGEAIFSDGDARNLCQKIGCYDSPNHSNYMKGFGNLISGSKDAGWRLTNPGLSRAAQIVKQLTDEDAV